MLVSTLSTDFRPSNTTAMHSVPYGPSATPTVSLRRRLIRLDGVINLTWGYFSKVALVRNT